MPYDANIPQPGDFLSDSQADILDNFGSANTTMSTNHYPFTHTFPDSGKHKFMQMPEIPNATVLAIPTTTANESAIYTKVGTFPAETNWFYRGENNGFEYQLTRSIGASTASFGNANANGWTFLPGNLLLQYGKVNAPGTSGVVNFPVAFNAAPYIVQVTLQRSSGNQSVTVSDGPAPSTSSFTYLTSSGGSNAIYWTAIGR